MKRKVTQRPYLEFQIYSDSSYMDITEIILQSFTFALERFVISFNYTAKVRIYFDMTKEKTNYFHLVNKV